MSETELEHLRSLIHRKTGLRERNGGGEKLSSLVRSRLQSLNLPSLNDYERLLRTEGPAADTEIRQLSLALTTGETHFFRDRGQFDLLERTILPTLIEEKQPSRTLRIWSAGCSTGEEAYSVAIALDALLPDRADWKIDIRGTDINPAALDKARAGTFTNWSFRVIDGDRKSAYFQHASGEWTIKPRIREGVRFSAIDLIQDEFPSAKTGIHDLDLILCRNVFIYFQSDSIRRVLEKMVAALRPGGYLLTAHGELQGQEPAQMETRTFPESSIYRKLRAGEFKARGGKWGLPPLTKRDSNDNHESCFAEGVRPHFPVRPLNSSSHSPGPLEQFEQRARECANSGDYAGAEQWCQRALGEDPFAVRIYYLLAKIAEEQKEEDRTKDLLKKALYLDPDYVPAYVDLAEAYDRENDSKRARKLRLCAIECLRRMNSDAAADIYEGTTPAELMLTLEAMVNGEASDGR